jgi:oxygen-independent coproporphyrinogen-3 oxidase
MWTYLPELLARPVPRYTSYPTAMEFGDDVGRDKYLNALDRVGDETPVSLYVHIPFCEKICWYCGCNTGAAGRQQRLADYVQALENEIAMVAERLNGRGRVQRISFGGGSPNALGQIEFVRLIDRIMTLFQCQSPDISVEIDPRNFGAGWVMILGLAGVKRVSLGVQTFAPHVQKAIGRVQPLAEIEKAVDLLRGNGISEINFDLMFGLPQQTMADLDETLDHAIRLAPSRISLFGYAHLPDLLPRQRRIDGSSLPDQELRFRQAERGYHRLTEAGYRAIGFDHFALEADGLAKAAAVGRVRRNFQGFTDDNAEVLIGFGASAISQFPDLIVQNEKRSGVYRDLIGEGRLAAVRGVAMDRDDRSRAVIIRELLCHGVAKIGPPYLYEARNALVEFEAQGLIEWKQDVLTIQPYALPYARLIASQFDRKRGAITGQLAAA